MDPSGEKVNQPRPTFYSDAMTWLNGRVSLILIYDDQGQQHILWSNEMDISIEDAIEAYIKKHCIDILKEIQECPLSTTSTGESNESTGP